ncbi:MAG: transporter [Verrucomicrobiales bacterium]|nr:transporter [Verrucomicrobiales bacterium]
MSKAWLCVGLLWVVALLNYLDRIMLTTMRESLITAIPMNDKQFGSLTSIFLLVYGILSPFAGFMADRFSRRLIIIGSLFVWSAVTWLTAHAQNYEQLLAARALMGISEAFYIPAAMALIVDYHRGPTRSLASGIHMSGCLLGSGLGGVGAWLAQGHDWAYAFNLFGIVGIVYSVVLVFFLPEAPREKSSTPNAVPQASFLPALKSLFSRSSFYYALIFWGILGMAGWGAAGWMPTYFKEHFHLSQTEAGFRAALPLQIAAMIGVVVGGALADFWSRKNERNRVFVVVVGLLLAAPGIMFAAKTDVQLFAIGGLVLYGLTRSFADSNMMPILCMVADTRYRATGYGVLNFFSCLVGGATNYYGGVLRDAHQNVSDIFKFSAISLVGCAVILFLVKPSKTVKTAAVALEEPVKTA